MSVNIKKPVPSRITPPVIEIKTEFGEYNIVGLSAEDFPEKIEKFVFSKTFPENIFHWKFRCSEKKLTKKNLEHFSISKF